jgi:hypothetical protein
MRIRTIKPEFWVSESVGRLSRDARLLFIGLWSFADDSGRGRGNIPVISGSLLPYDPDASKMVVKSMKELSDIGMIRIYKAEDGNTYYDIPKWLEHQKIEKPSKSRFPAFTEQSGNSRGIVGDISPLEQGTGNREQGKDQGHLFCSDLEASNSKPSNKTEIFLVLDPIGFDGVEESDMESWAAAYPAVDLGREAVKAAIWCRDNGARGKKKNYRRFLSNWFARAQERGGTK